MFVFVALLACGGGAAESLESARSELAASDWDGAVASAEAGLKSSDVNPAQQWQLELVRLEAYARGKKADQATATLERLATEHSKQVNGGLYATTAGQLHQAGDSAGAIAVLDAGMKRFPQDTELSAAIDKVKAAGSPEDVEMLKQLGYIQ
jgi:hypothetical protein